MKAKTPRLVKPLIKHYKAALSFLFDHVEYLRTLIDEDYKPRPIHKTNAGSISQLSRGWMIGRLDSYDFEMTWADLLDSYIERYGFMISATDMALYFRNQETEIKNEDQRLHVVQQFQFCFGEVKIDQPVDESSINQPVEVCHEEPAIEQPVDEQPIDQSIEPEDELPIQIPEGMSKETAEKIMNTKLEYFDGEPLPDGYEEHFVEIKTRNFEYTPELRERHRRMMIELQEQEARVKAMYPNG